MICKIRTQKLKAEIIDYKTTYFRVRFPKKHKIIFLKSYSNMILEEEKEKQGIKKALHVGEPLEVNTAGRARQRFLPRR